MKAVLLAGGVGSRMGTLTKDTPKPMLPLLGKPVLEYQIELLRRYGITEILLLSGFRSDVIRDYFGDGRLWGVSIEHRAELKPLGTAGAVKAIENELSQDFLVLYGDVMMELDLNAMVLFHLHHHSSATIAVHPNDHPYDSDLVETDGSDRIITFHAKPHEKDFLARNLVSAGVYILSPSILKHIDPGAELDFGKDILPLLADSDEVLYAYNTFEYIKDLGTVERLKEVEQDLASGKIALLNRENKQRAIFLDRDGVLNVEVNSLSRVEDVALLPNVAQAVRKINRAGYLSVVVTNQPVIAKGFITEEYLGTIHAGLEALLARERAYLTRIYYCPHHTDKGFEGERIEYKIDCACRKPATGMIDRAVRELNVDINNSFLIGDSTVDILTGLRAGLKTVLLRTGYAGEDGTFDCEPDFVFNDLSEAVDFIIEDYNRWMQEARSVVREAPLSSDRRQVVVISGLSRSGKSTFAAVLSQALAEAGKASRILKLDNWLLDARERDGTMTVRERYQYDKISADITSLLNGNEVLIQRYQAKSRSKGRVSRTLRLDPHEILIVEGVIGLDIEYLRQISCFRLFVGIPEPLRERRFREFYRYKGMDGPAVTALYAQRQFDESPIVTQSRLYADRVIDLGAP